MKRVKVHPHYNKISSKEMMCVSVTPDDGPTYYKGHVQLLNAKFVIHKSGRDRAVKEQVRNVHAWAQGELLYERDEPLHEGNFEDMTQVTYHYNDGRFLTFDGRDVTDDEFKIAVCNGPKFYVLENNV